MPSSIRVIHAHEFIRATPDGVLDLQTTKKLLLEIASAASPLADHEVILDVRNARSAMSVTDLWYLARELSTHRKTFSRKTAVLCPLKAFDDAAFFAICSQNRGLPVRAFTAFEDAFEWLIEGGG